MRKNELGFTMIELMIALAVTAFAVTGIYNLYMSQNQTYTVQDQVSDMQQNARVAMNILSSHVHTAGFGQPGWLNINGTPVIYDGVQVTDGGGVNPDTLELVGCFDSPPGTLSAAAGVGVTTLTLQSATEAGRFDTTTSRDIFIGERENAVVTNVLGAVLTIDTDPGNGGNQGLQYSYPVDTPVYLVQRFTYTIGTGALRRDKNTGAGAQQIAVNMDDLQATYAAPTLTLSVTARTRNEDPAYTHPTAGDGFRRMTLTSDIVARNRE